MKKVLLFSVVTILVLGTMLWAQKSNISLEKRWEKVNELAEKQLPESALKEVEAILKQAQKEKNPQQVIKAMVYKMRFTLEKNPDEAPALIKQFEAFTDKSTDPAERALLHSMTAELYAQYYQKGQWTINQRTEIKGEVPEDMKEWTKNIFFEKVSKHLAASLENPAVLQKTDALRFAELMEKGEDSRTMQPTLFDFLSNKRINLLTSLLNDASDYFETDNDFDSVAIADSVLVAVDTVAVDTTELISPEEDSADIDTMAVAVDTTAADLEDLEEVSPFSDEDEEYDLKSDSTMSLFERQIRETYRNLIEFRQKEGNVPALLYAELQHLIFDYKQSKSAKKDDEYLEKLNEFERKFANDEAVIEVLAHKANYYMIKSVDYRYENENEDSSLEEVKTKSNRNKRLAYDICVDGITRFPKYKRIQLLENIIKSITQRQIDISHNKVVKPFSNLSIDVDSKNVDVLKLSLYKINASALEYYNYKQKPENREKDYPDKSLIDTFLIGVDRNPDFGQVNTKFGIKTPDYGIYELFVQAKGSTDLDEYTRSGFVVTDLSFFQRAVSEEKEDLYVVDRVSGQRINDLNVEVYESQWKGNGYQIGVVEKLKTDQNGFCCYKRSKEHNNVLFFAKGKDAYFGTSVADYFYERENDEKQTTKVQILTDRSLYRPGQIVYFKGIACLSDFKMQSVIANKIFEVAFYDANYKKISSKKLTTNDFGSFSGEFAIPETGLNGDYTLQVGDLVSKDISVEEYKRPTFEVEIESPKLEVNFGEKVVFKGKVKAFSGYNVGDAKVKFRLVRSVHRFCYWFSESEKEISNGTVLSKSDGSFEISFIPEKTNGPQDRIYNYTIYVDVTDLKGETQQGEQSFSVGDKSLFIVADVPGKVDKNSDFKIGISTETINDEIINSKVNYKLVQLAETELYNEKLTSDTKLSEKNVILSGEFDTKTKELILNLRKFRSGRYKLILSTADVRGREVKKEDTFILYSNSDKKPPVKSYVWLNATKTECKVGEKAKIYFGTSATNVSMLYEIMKSNKVIERRWISLSNETKTFEILFAESFGAGVNVMFTFVRDEKIFCESVQITRESSVKRLTPVFSVFRNKLLPGEKAEWSVTIPECERNDKTAELLVGMYDASLDAIRSHRWFFNPTYYGGIFSSKLWSSDISELESATLFSNLNFCDVYDYKFDRLNWFGLVNYYMPKRSKYLRSGAVRMETATNNVQLSKVKSSRAFDVTEGVAMMMVEPPPALKSSVKFTAPIIKGDEEVIDDKNLKSGKVKPLQLRTNFNETAFFYPQLRTDEKGNVKFSFTAPESLTRWNVKMLAHTKDLYFGMFDTTAVTQKDLMVQMNLPRFVRRSDKLTLSANVVNLTDQPLSASVQFEMIDPASEKPIKLNNSAPKQVTLAANETKAVEWEVSEFSSFDLVTCKVVARAGNFSDGEQKYLPVLPDKVLVTESLPLTIRGNQTRTFNFESLIKNASNVDTKNLTLEFSANPAWYAVQALPTVAEPHDDNAIDLFTAYYANSLATWIANSTPKLATMFERWKQAGGSREALLSNLQKNAELKNMLLEETPWVMAARDETEQKRQIALLFDLNMQKNKNQQYWDKLLKLQLPSGGFTWFAGMPESRYITQEIMLNLGRLNRVTNSNLLTAYRLPLTAALKYLDLEIAKDFAELKKYNKDYQKENCVGNMQLFYLHVRSEFRDVPVDKSAVEAVKYYTEQSEKYWTGFTLYGKAMMAVVAQRNGKTQVAAEILKSLKENALKTDELGMYWARNTAGYFWHERPIAVQAAIIEAFREISNNTADIDELKIWLLKQKQTQRWDSPLATVDAIYALLNSGSDWLASDGKVEIKVGNTTLKPEMVEAGTGYFKQSLPTDKVTAETGKITVKKSDAGIGWGATYWQFYQELDKVSGQSGSLKVTKKLFVEKMQSNVKTLVPITQTEIRKGDRVITRLVVTTDRDLEFVALKDLRAACFEPIEQLSGYRWREGVGYYQTTKDASTQFFFSFLPKGTYVFEYPVWANNSGEYTSGITTIQCQYAPEFVSHTGGERIVVKGN